MAEPFLGEIRLMSFNFPPKGWAQCDGQFLSINQNPALFSLLGTYYGGNGQTTFALPDLRGRVPISQGSRHTMAERGGEVNHTLSISELPTHVHLMAGSSASSGGDANPNGRVLGGGTNVYHAATNLISLSSSSTTNTGGSQTHFNMQPFLTLNFCIALQGIFPSQN